MVFLQLLLFILFPALALFATKRSRALDWLGPVVLCYMVGIIAGNLPFVSLNESLSTTITEITVPLAIPLLLFSTNFSSWIRLARPTIISFGLCIVGVLLSSLAAARIFAPYLEESWKVAGMLTGVYTGGTPNLNAIGLALDVQKETFVLVHAADVVVGAIYLVFLMTVAQQLLLKFLPPFRSANASPATLEQVASASPARSLSGYVRYTVLALLLAAVTAGISIGLSLAVTGTLSFTMIILTLTTLGIAGSFIPKIRQMDITYDVGQYLLLVFSVAVGSMANTEKFLNTSPLFLYYVGSVVTLAVIIHISLAYLLKLDADTVIITSTAGIYGPPFIGPVANALKNREVVMSGLTTSLVGLALGNYLGLLVAYLLKP